MKRKVALTAVAVLFGLTASATAEPVNLRLATVGVGSAWYNYGAGIADMVVPNLPEGSTVDVLPIAGGVGNIKLIQNGEAEMGISFSTTAAEGCGGFGVFDEKHDKVRGLMGAMDIYYFGTFVTAASGAESWQDIVAAKDDFKLLTTKVGGTGETAVRQVLALMGSSKEDIASKGGSVQAMERASTASAIADGKADGWAHVVTKGHPVATQLTTTTDMSMLPLSEDVRTGMVEEHGWIATEVPAETFSGQDEAVPTVQTSSNILVSADVPEDVVYTFTKTIFENADKLRNIHAGLSDFDPKKAVDPTYVGNCQFHPGAVKYYREAGLME